MTLETFVHNGCCKLASDSWWNILTRLQGRQDVIQFKHPSGNVCNARSLPFKGQRGHGRGRCLSKALFVLRSVYFVQLDQVLTLHPPLFIPSMMSCHFLFLTGCPDVLYFPLEEEAVPHLQCDQSDFCIGVAPLLYDSSKWDVMESKGLGSFPEQRQHNFCSPLINQAYGLKPIYDVFSCCFFTIKTFFIKSSHRLKKQRILHAQRKILL